MVISQYQVADAAIYYPSVKNQSNFHAISDPSGDKHSSVCREESQLTFQSRLPPHVQSSLVGDLQDAGLLAGSLKPGMSQAPERK